MDEIGKLDYYDDAEERNLIQKFMDGNKNARKQICGEQACTGSKKLHAIMQTGRMSKRDNRDG